MKYCIRAIKYFIYIIFLLVIIIGVLILIGAVDANPETLFRNGYNSYWQIALIFAVLAAVYPLFGYATKEVIAPGEYSELHDAVVKHMDELGYELESEKGENMTFRSKSTLKKITRIWEDRITMTRSISGWTLEGLRKDIFHIAYGLEYKLRGE